MPERATPEELIEFANRVRKAGGGNPIDALMPAVPADAHQCLIAKNLNFNCRVTEAPRGWVMWIDDDPTAAKKIAGELGLETYAFQPYGAPPTVGVILPPEIGQIAADFDTVAEIAVDLVSFADEEYFVDHDQWPTDPSVMEPYYRAQLAGISLSERQKVKELVPYIIEASAEARSIATLINDDGSVVV